MSGIVVATDNEFSYHGKFLCCQAQCFFGNIVAYSFHFNDYTAGSNGSHETFGRTFTFTHADFCRFLGDVGLGADMTAMAEAKEWLEAKAEGKKKTTSCCPAFKLLVEKHFPELADRVSETVSPMCAVSRYIKENYEDAVTVFVGPCIGKKAESAAGEKESADYALTYGEIRAMLRAKDVKLEPEAEDNDQSTLFGKKFANAGGVTAAVIESMKELGCDDEVKVCKCDGIDACKKALTLMKFNRFQDDFMEGMACEGGCVGGPSRHRDPNMAMRDRKTALDNSTDINITENLEKQGADKIDMVRD